MMLVLTYSWHMSLESHRRILTLIVDCIGTEKPDKFSPILCPLPEIDVDDACYISEDDYA